MCGCTCKKNWICGETADGGSACRAEGFLSDKKIVTDRERKVNCNEMMLLFSQVCAFTAQTVRKRIARKHPAHRGTRPIVLRMEWPDAVIHTRITEKPPLYTCRVCGGSSVIQLWSTPLWDGCFFMPDYSMRISGLQKFFKKKHLHFQKHCDNISS